MQHKQRLSLTLVLIILSMATLLSSCGGGSGNKSNTVVIGVSIQSREAQFYQEMEAGMKAEAARFGYSVVFVDANRNSAKQHGQVEDFITQRVAAIVLTPFDSQAIGSAVLEANNAGVPVFTADIANSSALGQVVSHIASNNVQGGQQAGKLMCQALGPSGGKVAIIDQPSVTSVQDRVKGFRQAIAGCNITVVADLTGEGQRDRSNRVMEDLLQSHKDLQGVFAINDDSALGAANAIQAAGLAGRITVVGYDATPEAQAAIKAGLIYGDAIQHPDQIGRQTIDAIHDYLEHKPVSSHIDIPVGTFTKADAK